MSNHTTTTTGERCGICDEPFADDDADHAEMIDPAFDPTVDVGDGIADVHLDCGYDDGWRSL